MRNPLHPRRSLGNHDRKDGAQNPHGHHTQRTRAGDDAAGDIPGPVSVNRGPFRSLQELRRRKPILPILFLIQQPFHVHTEQPGAGQQFRRVRQGRPLFPAAHRLTGDAQLFRQGLLAQPLPLPQPGQLLSKGHESSSSSLFRWSHHTKRRRESPPQPPDTAATKRNIPAKTNVMFFLFCSNSALCRVFLTEGCDHMPDTAEAVAQYGSAVYRLAYAMTRSRSDADDVFQEVFLRLHRSAPDFANEATPAGVAPAGDGQLRQGACWPPPGGCGPSRWRMSMPTQDSVESAVDEALAHLPGKYRAVIHLFYYEGYQTEEIARILGRSPSTVRAQLTRARQKLREHR